MSAESLERPAKGARAQMLWESRAWLPLVAVSVLCLLVFLFAALWLNRVGRELTGPFSAESREERLLKEWQVLAHATDDLSFAALDATTPDARALLTTQALATNGRVDQLERELADVSRQNDADHVLALQQARARYVALRSGAFDAAARGLPSAELAVHRQAFEVQGTVYLAAIDALHQDHVTEVSDMVNGWARSTGRALVALAIISGCFLVAVGVVMLRLNETVRRAAAERREREEQQRMLRTVIDESPDIVLVTDEAGRIVIANRALARLLGTTTDALLGRTEGDFNPDVQQVEAVRRSDEEVRRSGRTARMVEECTDLVTGERRRFQSAKTPFEEDGQAMLLVIARDVTELEQARSRAEYSERRLEVAMEIAGEGLWDWHIPSGRVTNTPGWASMLGYGRDELERHVDDFAAMLRVEDRPVVFAAIQRCLEGREPYSHEHHLRRADGREMWVHDRGEVVERDAEGRPVRMIGAFTDITARRDAQLQALRAREEADAANASKTRLLASMSHEIRTPIHGVIGLTEIALTRHVPEDARRHLEMIKGSARTLLVLVNDLLHFAKLDADHVVVESIDFDLFSEIECVLRPLAIRAHTKGQVLWCEIPHDTPRDAHGDPTRLRQVLTNLLDNAIKFTDQGLITLSVRRSADADRGDLGGIEFVVEDTGRGIPADKLGVIFEPFVQADPAIARQHGGTGLGLTITAKLVERMGGEISVDSTVGRGSRFVFRLPLVLGRLSLPATQPLRRLRVLVMGAAERPWQWLASELGRSGAAVARVDSLAAALQSPEFTGITWDAAVVVPDARTGITPEQWAASSGRLTVSRWVALQRSGTAGPAEHERLAWDQRAIVVETPIVGDALWRAVSAQPAEVDGKHAPLGVDGRLSPSADSRLISGQDLSPAEPTRQWRGERVMLVDDNEVNRVVGDGLLRSIGLEVELASDGMQALQILRERHDEFIAVLMDIQLPQLDGFMTTRMLRQMEAAHGWSRLPVIAATAFAMDDDRERCLLAGMNAHMSKPFHRSELSRVICEFATRGAAGFKTQPA